MALKKENTQRGRYHSKVSRIGGSLVITVGKTGIGEGLCQIDWAWSDDGTKLCLDIERLGEW